MPDLMFEKLRLLIVDDNKHMRELLTAPLVAFGCNEVMQASNPDEAFSLSQISNQTLYLLI